MYLRIIVFFQVILVAGCGGGLSDSEKINVFKADLLSYSSDNNLISSLSNDGNEEKVVVSFESSETVSIASGLVSTKQLNWEVEFNFKDNTSLTIGAIGGELPVTFDAVGNPVTPLSRAFTIELPYDGLITWTTKGRNGSGTDIPATPVIANSGSNTFIAHGLYRSGSTSVDVEYLNAAGASRYSKSMQVNHPEYNANIDHDVTISSFINTQPESLRLFLMKQRAFNNALFMVDQFGDMRWFLKSPETVGYGVQQTVRGTILWADTYKIWEFSVDGDEITNISIPEEYGAIHHDIVDLGDRKFLLTVSNPDPDSETIHDFIILFDAADGVVERSWDLNQSVPKTSYYIHDDECWFHNNAIEIDPTSNALLLSGQRLGVVKVSWDNELLWMLTDPLRYQDASSELQEKILFNPFGDVITWGQHDIRYDSDDDMYYLFDNGRGRNYEQTEIFSRGVKFKVNEDDFTFEILETFGEEYPDLHSPIISGIDYNIKGSVLLNFGSIGYYIPYSSPTDTFTSVWKSPQPDHGTVIQEYSSEQDLILDVRLSGKNKEGKGKDKDPGTYRVRYSELYPN